MSGAADQRAFTAAVEAARSVLVAALARRIGEAPPEPAPAPAGPARHDALAARLGLSPFEHWLLLLAAGAEIDADVRHLCAAWHGDNGADRPSFALALAVHPRAHWSALSPAAPLRRFGLLEPVRGAGLTDRALIIDELVLHHCLGLDALAIAVADRLTRVPEEPLFDSWRPLARELGARLASPGAAPVEIAGPPAHARAVAAAAVAGRPLYRPLAEARLAADDPLVERLVRAEDGFLLVEQQEQATILARGPLAGRLILTGAAAGARTPWRVGAVAASEREAAWRQALNGNAPDPALLTRLAGDRSLSAGDIASIARAAGHDGPGEIDRHLSRRHALLREELTGLALPIEPRSHWDDLILPEAERAQLARLIDQVRHRATVVERWGFGAKSGRGLGASALFAGPSGTGKTMASEIIAGALGHELYRVDLAAVVSKYIGETEKHLERLFRAAEHAPVVLLFDEADALFGKRGAVRDGLDRFANQEVSFLLQRIESFEGFAILTTNLPEAIDPAFIRRFRFLVNFPFPDHARRVAIWKSVLPAALPTEALDLDRLARVPLSGGAIRNVALNGAYLAAAAEGRLSMAHLLQAVEAELAKVNQRLRPELLQ